MKFRYILILILFIISVSIINLSCVPTIPPTPQHTVKNPPTSQQTVNKPPTSKRYSQVADVIEDRLSWDGDYTISKVWELTETTDWYHGKCWTQTIEYSMNGITNKCLFFIKKDLGGWNVEGWEIID